MPIPQITDINLANKRVLLREDFNVPIDKGIISSDARIRAALPTIQYAIDHGAQVMLMSHLGRPTEGEQQAEFSLAPVAERLGALLKRPVKFIKDWIDGVQLAPGEIALFENVRMLQGEKKNDPALAKKMAALCDVFVMDAFATAHRAEASTCGVAQYAPLACAGLLLTAELHALETALKNPKHPLMAIIGGSKVSTKLAVLENLINKVDRLIVGGGIANTFLLAEDFPIGKSLCETDLVPTAKKLLALAKQRDVTLVLPVDVVVAKEFSATAQAIVKPINEVASDEMILDIGPAASREYAALAHTAGTILWNGPVGVFEFPAFSQGTETLAHAIANSSGFSIAGGGDTLAAIEKYNIADQISYISTGGGAFLEFVEGKELPAIKILQERGTVPPA